MAFKKFVFPKSKKMKKPKGSKKTEKLPPYGVGADMKQSVNY